MSGSPPVTVGSDGSDPLLIRGSQVRLLPGARLSRSGLHKALVSVAIPARRNQRLRLEDEAPASLELGHPLADFRLYTTTLRVGECQVKLAHPPATSLDRAPVFVERSEGNFPRLRDNR